MLRDPAKDPSIKARARIGSIEERGIASIEEAIAESETGETEGTEVTGEREEIEETGATGERGERGEREEIEEIEAIGVIGIETTMIGVETVMTVGSEGREEIVGSVMSVFSGNTVGSVIVAGRVRERRLWRGRSRGSR